MARSRLTAVCPGSTENSVTVVSGATKCQFGIGNPKNIGTCPIYIDALDGDGNLLSLPDGTLDLRLAPGESISHYYPPSGTQLIVFVCDKECVGQAVLEFDTPNAMLDKFASVLTSSSTNPAPQVRTLLYNDEHLGQGFNGSTGLSLGDPISVTATGDDGGGQEVSSDVLIVHSSDELINALDLSFQAEGRYLFSSASLKAEFSQDTQYNSISTFIVAKVRVRNPIKRITGFTISDPAQRMLNAPGGGDQFKAAYGDYFVRSMITGGEFYAVLRITSVDDYTRSNLAITAQLAIQGYIAGATFDSALLQANSERQTLSEFRGVYYQRGGSGTTSAPTLSVADVLTRINQFTSIVVDNPVPLTIEVATYDTLPLPLPSPTEQQDMLFALSDTDRQKQEFIRTRNDLQFAEENPQYFENPPPGDALEAAVQVYNQAINAAMDHARKLSNGEIPAATLVLADYGITLPAITLKRLGSDWVQVPHWGTDRALIDDPRNNVWQVGLNLIVTQKPVPPDPGNPIGDPPIDSLDPPAGTLVPRGTIVRVVEECDQTRFLSEVWATIPPPGPKGSKALLFPFDITDPTLPTPLSVGTEIRLDVIGGESVKVKEIIGGGRIVVLDSPTQHDYTSGLQLQTGALWGFPV